MAEEASILLIVSKMLQQILTSLQGCKLGILQVKEILFKMEPMQ